MSSAKHTPSILASIKKAVAFKEPTEPSSLYVSKLSSSQPKKLGKKAQSEVNNLVKTAIYTRVLE